MNICRARARWTAAIAAIVILAGAGSADAGLLILSGDSNIANPLGGGEPGNDQFFLNVLGGGTSVLVLETTVTPVFTTPVNDFYNSQPGVTSSLFSGEITAAVLAGVDLFYSALPDDFFTASELDALGDFLDAGGTIFFAGDNPGFAPNPNARINAALAALGSGMQILGIGLDIGLFHTQPFQVVPDPLTAGVANFQYGGMSQIAGGNPLFLSLEQHPFIAYEQGAVAGVPEPGTVSLLGAGVLAAVVLRRRGL